MKIILRKIQVWFLFGDGSFISYEIERGKCAGTEKILHVKFFPSSSLLPNGAVAVSLSLKDLSNFMTKNKTNKQNY